MKHILFSLLISLLLIGCSEKTNTLTENNLKLINRQISSTETPANTISLNGNQGAGLAILKDTEFETGTIEIELKGENNPGMSFVGLAYNIQNDTTYEAIYFRPFNFQSKEKIRREHSIQYISLPEYDWRILRTNNEGEFEAEYKRQPSPDEWFSVKIMIEVDKVTVHDKEFNTELFSARRLETSKSKKIGLWVGNNSKGEFRNLKVHR